MIPYDNMRKVKLFDWEINVPIFSHTNARFEAKTRKS